MRPKKYRVGRPINGISLNGLEYVMMSCAKTPHSTRVPGDYVLFDSMEKAVEYLVSMTGEPALNIIHDFNSGALVLEEDK